MGFLGQLKARLRAKIEFVRLCKEAREEIENEIIKSTSLEDLDEARNNSGVDLARVVRRSYCTIYYKAFMNLEEGGSPKQFEVSGELSPRIMGQSWGGGTIKGRSYGKRSLIKDHCRVLYHDKSTQKNSGKTHYFELDDGLLSLVTGDVYWIESSRYRRFGSGVKTLVRGRIILDSRNNAMLEENATFVRDDGKSGRYTNSVNPSVYTPPPGSSSSSGNKGSSSGGVYRSATKRRGNTKKKKTATTTSGFASSSTPTYDYGCTGVGTPVHDCGY